MSRLAGAESTDCAAVRGPESSAALIIHVDLWTLPLDGAPQDVEAASYWLTAEERGRASRFQDEPDAVRFVLRRAMRRVLLGHHCGVTPGEISIRQEAGGPPRLTDHRAVQFSTAHRENIGVVVIANRLAVGVDIEPLIPDDGLTDLIATCLHPREAAVCRALPRADRAAWLTQIWTRKEAFLKMRGVGFAIEPRDVCVLPESVGTTSTVTEHDHRSEPVTLADFEPCPGWCGTIAVEGAGEVVIRPCVLPGSWWR